MTPVLADLARLVGRVLLTLVFIQAGWGQVSSHDRIVGYIAANGLPMPEIAYIVGIASLLGVGGLVLVGLFTRIAALYLAGFSVVLAVVFHFHPGDPAQMSHYFKDLGLAGGLLYVFAGGPGAFSLDRLLRRGQA